MPRAARLVWRPWSSEFRRNTENSEKKTANERKMKYSSQLAHCCVALLSIIACVHKIAHIYKSYIECSLNPNKHSISRINQIFLMSKLQAHTKKKKRRKIERARKVWRDSTAREAREGRNRRRPPSGEQSPMRWISSVSMSECVCVWCNRSEQNNKLQKNTAGAPTTCPPTP